MDDFTIHCAALPRRFPSPLRIGTIGTNPAKTGWIRRTFDSWNFSFILAGRGIYRADGREWAVRAPCVITQRPGVYQEYGPPDGETWDEIFFIYPDECGSALLASGLMADERYWWPISDPAEIHARVRAIADLGRQGAERSVDRIDRACEQLVLESLLGADGETRRGPAAAVAAIRTRIEGDPLAAHDLNALVRSAGLSPTHFRRLWAQQVSVPPDRYRRQLVLRLAARRLVERDEPVAAIAAELGYDDPLYFSRRFRAFTGMAPTAYRRHFRGVW